MNSTDTVSVLEARAKTLIRQLLLNAKIKSVNAEIDYLVERKAEFE